MGFDSAISPRRRALITGASAGIGLELARVFAAEGFDLVLVARSRDKLEHLARTLASDHAIDARAIIADLGEAGAAARLFDMLSAEERVIDVLVNNAGAGSYGFFAETDPAKLQAILSLNVVVLTELTSLFVRPMIARGYGRILNLSSVAAFQPTPMIAVYGATKTYILSLTEALSVELEGTGVRATALCPGFTGTEMIENLSAEAGDTGLVADAFKLDPAVVAREGYEACMAGTPVHVNGALYRLGLLWESWQPRWLVRTMGAAIAGALRPSDR